MPLDRGIYAAVVRVVCETPDGRFASGSGIVISKGGLILTNNHVVENPDFGDVGHITVEFPFQVERELTGHIAEPIIRNDDCDLAVLRTTGLPLARYIDVLGAPRIDASWLERQIRILGYPEVGGGTLTVTRGIVSGFDEYGNIKTDAEINPGNSGGLALDDLDHFVGVPSFIVSGDAGKIGFLISPSRIKEWWSSALIVGPAKAAAPPDSKLSPGSGEVRRLIAPS